MRVASSQYQSLINISLQQNQERINFLTQQMSSGLRIQLPSDDPIGNVRSADPQDIWAGRPRCWMSPCRYLDPPR